MFCVLGCGLSACGRGVVAVFLGGGVSFFLWGCGVVGRVGKRGSVDPI